MKLMFNKTTYEGHWFNDDENSDGFTEKIPPHTNVEWDDKTGGFIEKPPITLIEETIIKEACQ